MSTVYAIIGTRPQLIKHAALQMAHSNQFDLMTIHTGQHYDWNMDRLFFEELEIAEPSFHLKTGSREAVSQLANMMLGIEQICSQAKPDLILVYGDTNSTLAGALAANKMNIPLAHIEAGMRSNNTEMPEETNRILTDLLSDLLFTSCAFATNKLRAEKNRGVICESGDLMKDLVKWSLNKDKLHNIEISEDYYYATIHRPYNVDDPVRLAQLLNSFETLDKLVILSLHPRTKTRMSEFGINSSEYSNIHFIEPQGYFWNLSYMSNADAILTDSGGMQKEAYWLKKKCVTLRKETEWTETLEKGANALVFDDLDSISKVIAQKGSWNKSMYGDGRAADKIIENLCQYLQDKIPYTELQNS